MKNIVLVGGLAALLFSCEKDGKKQEFYYPEPTISGIYPTEGYTLSQLVINGENFGDRLEPVSVQFGDKKAEVVSCKNNRIIVVVPEDAASSEVTLKLWQYEFDNVGKFTVIPKPVITSIASENATSTLFAEENEIVNIHGMAFGTSKDELIVKIGSKTAEVVSVADNLIKVKAPAGYGMGAVSINLKGYETEYGNLLQSSYTGDITTFALKNSNRPFTMTEDAPIGNWVIPTDWKYNDAFYYENEVIRSLFINDTYPEGCISLLCNIWDRYHKPRPLNNAKMYQETALPPGQYTITWSIADCTTQGGDFGTIIGVTKGKGTLPDLKNVNGVWTPVDESVFVENGSGGKVYYRITDHIVEFDAKRGPVDYSMDMILTETTEVTIGFVVNITPRNGGAVNIVGITVEKVN